MFRKLVYDNKIYEQFEIDEGGVIQNVKTNHTYKHAISGTGYLVVYLPMGKRGSVKCIRVHKAVAETFLPNPNKLPVVHHKDEDKLNCEVGNLEWVTHKTNTQYHLVKLSKSTELYNNRKLTEEEVKYIRSKYGIYSLRQLAFKFGVSKTTILNVVNNRYYNGVV